jgi:hypothetical protein
MGTSLETSLMMILPLQILNLKIYVSKSLHWFSIYLFFMKMIWTSSLHNVVAVHGSAVA